MTEDAGLSWGLTQRFEFVEWRAYWVGRLNRRDLEVEFRISAAQASLDLREYQRRAPNNIEYNATERTFLATAHFEPKFLKLSPERYLLQLQAIQTGGVRKSDTWFDELPPVDVPPPIVRGPQAETLRLVLKAIQLREELRINYQSLTSTGMRTICPHSLANDGYRWHVRAWSVEREEFRDYVLGRILSVSEPKPCRTAPPEDIEWQSFVTLVLIAHPDLDSKQKEVIERDYQLTNGELAIRMRVALSFYFVRRHNLDLREGQIDAPRAQLYLRNFNDYEAALRDAKERARLLAAAHRSTASEERREAPTAAAADSIPLRS